MDKIYIGMVDCARGNETVSWTEACLDDEEAGRFDRLRQPLGRRCFVEGRRLARQIMADLSGLPAASLACAIDSQGKPGFPALPDWHFNISHSGTLVACACARFPLGLDIEYHKPDRNRLDVAERFFSPAECAAIGSSATIHDTPARFYHYWTLKEAWLKWHGIGLAGLAKVPEYQFETAADPRLPGTLRRLDAQAMDANLALWHLAKTGEADGPADHWSMALACGTSADIVWHHQFAMPPDLACELLFRTIDPVNRASGKSPVEG